MSPIRASDLPPEVRKQLGIKATRSKPSRAGVGDAEPCPGRCGCGERFPNAAAWQRHADNAGHRVWSIDPEGER